MLLNQEIKKVIESLAPTTLYLRAITLNEANVSLPQKDLIYPIAIHAALPLITSTQQLSRVTISTPVQVLFLMLNTSQDDTGEQIDDILASTKLLADQFYDMLSVSSLLDPTLSIEQYTLNAVPAFSFSDEVLSGWQLELDFPQVRNVYLCG